MFLGAGIGAYSAAMFHLVTHAFFKALLFLAAGIIIHRLGGEQDIRRMGGLRRRMPYTHAVFLIGTLALVGIPPLSGFWSKDAIIASALATGGVLGWLLFLAGLAGALLTGLYSFRLYFAVFHGEPSPLVSEHEHDHEHGEGPRSMLLPVGALAVLTAIAGFLSVPGLWNLIGDWLQDVAEPLVEPTTAQDYLTSLIAVTLGVFGIALAHRAYRAGRELVVNPGLRTVLEHKLYFDELYDAIFSRPAQALAVRLRDDVETPVVQGSLVEIGSGVRDAAGGVARLQTGLVRTYVLAIAASLVVLVIVVVAVR